MYSRIGQTNKGVAYAEVEFSDWALCDAEIHFTYYIAPIKCEDDYDDLTIESILIAKPGIAVDIMTAVSESEMRRLEEICWDSIKDFEDV